MTDFGLSELRRRAEAELSEYVRYRSTWYTGPTHDVCEMRGGGTRDEGGGTREEGRGTRDEGSREEGGGEEGRREEGRREEG